MTTLADTLDALDANKFPATIRIAPAVLNGLQQLEPDAVRPTDRFAATSSGRRRTAVAARSIGCRCRPDRSSLYTSWRRDGQAPSCRASDSVQRSSARRRSSSTTRSAPRVPRCASTCGAGLMVMTPSDLRRARRHDRRLQRLQGRAVAAQLPNNTTLDVAVVDRHHLATARRIPLATPAQTSIYAVADLLALRQSIEIVGRERAAACRRDRRRPISASPMPQLLGSITALIAETPGLAASDARRRCTAHRPSTGRPTATSARHVADSSECRCAEDAIFTPGAVEQRDRRSRLDAAGRQRPAEGVA